MNGSLKFGCAGSGIVPLRREPSDASEMCTQVLLGETFRILEVKERWFRIESDFDGYRGWVNRSESTVLSDEEYQEWKRRSERNYSWNFTYRAFSSDREALLVPPGARVVATDSNGTVEVPAGTFKPRQEVSKLSNDSPVDTALDFLGTPYMWGGRTDVGVDCSGLIQTVYLLYGKQIPCDSWKQEEFFSRQVERLEDAERGDVIFFNPGKERVSHVGFYLGDGALLHASGKVRINLISNEAADGDREIEFNERLANSIHSIYRSELN